MNEVLINGIRYVPADGIAAKAADTDMAALNVVKAVDERRFSLGLAYPAMKADASKAMDGHRDYVSEAVLEETAWNWLKSYREINLFHKDGSSGHGEVVESYVWRAPDWVLTSPVDGSQQVIKAGDWVMGARWDDYGWELIKARMVNGWSPEGGARRATPSPERLAQLRP